MGLFRLHVEVTSKNMDRIAEIRARLADFTPVWANILSEWARGNQDKFAQSREQELSGVDQPPARWDPVTERYYRQKHGPVVRGDRKIFPDWLMVRTGSLMQSLTTRGAFAEYMEAQRLVFGVPLDGEDAKKALYNRRKRPTIFLGRSDRNMIRREFQRYLSMGENYKTMLFSASSRRYALQKEFEALDMNFAEAAA